MPAANSEGPRFVRRSMSPGVLSVLVPVYQFNPYPNRGEYEHLSIVVHLESERIKNWFNNRRRKDIRAGILCQACRYFKAPLSPHQHIHSTEMRPCYSFYHPSLMNPQLMPMPQQTQMAPQQPDVQFQQQDDTDAEGSLVIDENVDIKAEEIVGNVAQAVPFNEVQNRPVFQQPMIPTYCNRPGCFCFQVPNVANFPQLAPLPVDSAPSNLSDQSNPSRSSPESTSNGSSGSSQWPTPPPPLQDVRPFIPSNWQPNGGYPMAFHRQEPFTQVVKFHPYFNAQQENDN